MKSFFSFETLVTPDAIKAIFIINTVLILFSLGILIGTQDFIYQDLSICVLGLILNRIFCEYLIIQFKISEDLSKIVKNQESK